MGLGGLENKINLKHFEYDFSKEGGAVGDINLRGGKIPTDAIVLFGTIYVETAVTSDGAATIALKIEGAGDVLAATGKASFSANAILDGVPDWTAANAVRATDNQYLVATVGTAALTAGKFTVALAFTLPKA